MAATMNAATFMGKNFSTVQNFIMNPRDLTLKQMFDVTAQLVNNQEEIHGLDKIHLGKNSWRQLSLIGDEQLSLFSARKSMSSQILCCASGGCLANARVVKVNAKKFGVRQWSFVGPGSEKKWYSAENSPQGAWDHIADEMLLEFAGSGHPIFRATTPLSSGILKSKGHGKLSIHFTATQQLKQFFAS